MHRADDVAGSVSPPELTWDVLRVEDPLGRAVTEDVNRYQRAAPEREGIQSRRPRIAPRHLDRDAAQNFSVVCQLAIDALDPIDLIRGRVGFVEAHARVEIEYGNGFGSLARN